MLKLLLFLKFTLLFNQKEDPGSVQQNCVSKDEKSGINMESVKTRNEPLMEAEPGEGSHAEYTELALDCLDLKAQEELLSPPLSGDKYSTSLTEFIMKTQHVSFSCTKIDKTGCECAGLTACADMAEKDLAEELPLCCCRMETPHSGGSLAALNQTCMAMENMDGMVKTI